jgi:iron complex outermembrane receptor protein
VEVLKGPQGTLFGLTTSAGVINITTNPPDPSHFSAILHSELSNEGWIGAQYGQQVVQGVVNLPLTTDSALRVAANVDLHQGVDFNTLAEKFTQHQDYSLRARYLWEPDSRLTVNLIADYTHSNDLGADFFTITKANPADTARLATCGVIVRPGNRDYCDDRPETNPISNYGGSARVDYDFRPVKFTSITQDRGIETGPSDSTIFRDITNPTQIFTLGSTFSSNLFTQELRLASPSTSRLEYTAGLFFSRYVTSNGGGGINVQVSPFPGLIIPIVTNGGSFTHLLDTSAAVFGQATYHVTDKFQLIFGARYTNERLSVTATTNTAPFAPIPNAAGAVTENNFSYKAGVQYDFTPEVMAYAFAAQGYKGPEINNANPLVPATIINPELPMDYEGGLKTVLLDGKLAADLSAWYMDVRGFQGQQCLPVPTGLACGPVNYTGVVTYGAEVDVYGQPLPGLSVNTGLIYNPATYPPGTLASDGSGDLGGEQLGNAPLWKFTFSGEYDHPIVEGIEGFISANAVYKSDLNLDNSNDPNLHFPAHWIWGGQIGARFDHGRYDIALFGRNLGNVHEPVLIFPNFPNPGDYGAYYTPQSFRLVGIVLDARF